MQAGKRYTFWQAIKWSKKYIFLFLIINSIPVVAYYFFGFKWLQIPWQPLSLVGIAVAFYLGFKNNSSYERLWEARKIWGGIVNTSRTFTIMTRDFVTNEFATNKVTDTDLHQIHITIVHRHVAWLKALTYQMREVRAWEHHEEENDWLRKMADVHSSDNHFEKLRPYLSEKEYDYIMSKGNKASHLLSLQSKAFLDLKLKGLIEDFRHMELANVISELYRFQGMSERIKNFPFPRQYASLNYFFITIFLLLLPFGMLGIFANLEPDYMIWLAIPFTTIVSWVFHTMEMIGEFSENPFEGLYNDVPITQIATSIEIDIREMLEETDLPEPVKPIGEFDLLF